MTHRALIWTGGICALVIATCCFTPVLVIALGAVGLIGAVAYLDIVLLPLLALCIGVTVYAIIMERRRNG